MASAFANFLSFILPAKPPPPTPSMPPHLTLPASQSTQGLTKSQQNSGDSFAPLVLQNQPRQQQTLPSDLSSVICPSLAYANTLFFHSGYHVQVIVDDNEPDERLLGRFRREIMKAGVIQECKRRKFFETPQDKKKRKSLEAAKRNRRRRPPPRTAIQDKQEISAKKKAEDDDNWDLPEGDAPY